MFDPSQYKMTSSADIEILDVSGNTIFLDENREVPWTITVCSPGVTKATKAAFEYKQAISGDLLAQSRGAKSKSSDVAERQLRADFLMKITEGKLQRGLVDGLVEYVRYAAWLNATPQPKDPKSRALRQRRKDVEEVLGYVPEPDLDAGAYLLEILFQIGPAFAEAPLTEGDLEPWERRRDVKLEPWEAECVISMSRAYLGESHTAREPSALPPWPGAVKMWRFVCDKINAPKLEENLAIPIKDKAPNGNRKRHRNPTPG
ncbi:hypothetical protein Q3G72_017525 [Acer saccharum]|nr:hypothetical protein Q3G72_017525 [Acer saccharum]